MKKILLTWSIFLISLTGWAEVSPLPESHFNFIYNTQEQPLIRPEASEFVVCQDRLCMQASALGIYGSQRMQCGPGACTAVAYEFDPFARLVISFEDGSIRTSNIFEIPSGLIHKFNVYVEKDALNVQPVDTPPAESLWKRPQAWGALALILGLELLCAAAFILYTKKRFTILYGVAVANLVTAIFTWCFLVHHVAQSALWWVCAVVLEAILIRFINRKDISLKEAGLLSIMTNVTSYTLGMIISFVIAQM